eukprot:gene3362-3404_t
MAGGESEVKEGSTVMTGWVGWRGTDFNHSVWQVLLFGWGKWVVERFEWNWHLPLYKYALAAIEM